MSRGRSILSVPKELRPMPDHFSLITHTSGLTRSARREYAKIAASRRQELGVESAHAAPRMRDRHAGGSRRPPDLAGLRRQGTGVPCAKTDPSWLRRPHTVSSSATTIASTRPARAAVSISSSLIATFASPVPSRATTCSSTAFKSASSSGRITSSTLACNSVSLSAKGFRSSHCSWIWLISTCWRK